jgi:hypothetical protein
MHMGIAPPQGLALSNLRSNKKVSIPAFANVSAAEEPAGPDPTTATLRTKVFLPYLFFIGLTTMIDFLETLENW